MAASKASGARERKRAGNVEQERAGERPEEVDHERLEAAADRVYGLPLEGFTAARDELARTLRSEGDRETADAVRRLRKPTAAAWAINQLARQRPRDVDALLDAGARLRDAQESLLASGDRGAFREAADRERAVVSRLADAAAELPRPGGASLTERVRATLHAAALDEGVRNELRAGRVLREREPAGLGLFPGEAPHKADRRGRRSARGRLADDVRRRLDSVQRQLREARSRERRSRQRVTDAERAVASARDRAETALDDLHRAEDAETAARREARDAADEISRLEDELAGLQRTETQ